MIRRAYEPLDPLVVPNKVFVLYGPRRVGKTTLLRSFLAGTSLKYKLDSGDDIRTQQILSSQDFAQILAYAEGYDLLAIDEAQNIPNVGMGLKIIVDQIPGIRVIATGSSSFELAGQLGEPLTSRKTTRILYPVAQFELMSIHNRYELQQNLEQYLIFGSYPEVLLAKDLRSRIEVLTEITNSYLLKDILALDRIRFSRTLLDLLKLLAHQVGGEVSFNELSTQLGVDLKTVKRYLVLLEKGFVIYRLNGFSRNLRQEVTSKSKFYFYDNGIRNAVIAQFNPLSERNDRGALWENFMVTERMKLRDYRSLYANVYFWRTYQQQEIDLVEDYNGKLHAYEFKWLLKNRKRVPITWQKQYPDAGFELIDPGNYLEFITPQGHGAI